MMKLIWTIEYFLRQKGQEIWAGIVWFFWSGRTSVFLYFSSHDIEFTDIEFPPIIAILLSWIVVMVWLALFIQIFITVGAIGYYMYPPLLAPELRNLFGYFLLGITFFMGLITIPLGTGMVVMTILIIFSPVGSWIRSNWRQAKQRVEKEFENETL